MKEILKIEYYSDTNTYEFWFLGGYKHNIYKPLCVNINPDTGKILLVQFCVPFNFEKFYDGVWFTYNCWLDDLLSNKVISNQEYFLIKAELQ